MYRTVEDRSPVIKIKPDWTIPEKIETWGMWVGC